MDQLEMEMQLQITEKFIAADASQVTMLRSTRVSDGAGGTVSQDEAPVTVDPVTVRMIPRSDRTSELVLADGRVLRPEFAVLAMPDVDIQRYDEFLWNGVRWQVASVHELPVYEKKGDVVRSA